MKKILLLLAVTAMALTALVACRNENNQGNNEPAFLIPAGHPLEMMEEALSHFPQFVDTGEAHVAGTTFHWGLGSPSAWPGILGANAIFGQAALDADLASLIGTGGSLVAMSPLRTFGEGGVATAIPNVEAKTLTIQQEIFNVYWHDGVPLTLADLYFTYHVLAHPENPNVTRFQEGSNRLITGIMDYREGNASSIAGLTLSDDHRTLTIQL
jgi:peptide/nickel transport system substrate-binding protein